MSNEEDVQQLGKAMELVREAMTIVKKVQINISRELVRQNAT